MSSPIGRFAGDPQLRRIVPPSGATAQLVIMAAAAMAFLAVFALALSFAAGRLASQWGSELADSATIQIAGPAETRASKTETALKILETTTGVAFARALTTEDQQALLEPWFGAGYDTTSLPLPQLIEIVREDDFDADGLRLRLTAEVPDAILDDHAAWRAPLVAAADRLRALAALSVFLMVLVMAALVTLAAKTALAANTQVIAVLRLVGATDRYIAQAFVRRFTIRASIGAAAGLVFGAIAVRSLPPVSGAGGLLSGLGFQGVEWLWPLLIPPVVGLITWAATHLSARGVLRSFA